MTEDELLELQIGISTGDAERRLARISELLEDIGKDAVVASGGLKKYQSLLESASKLPLNNNLSNLSSRMSNLFDPQGLDAVNNKLRVTLALFQAMRLPIEMNQRANSLIGKARSTLPLAEGAARGRSFMDIAQGRVNQIFTNPLNLGIQDAVNDHAGLAKTNPNLFRLINSISRFMQSSITETGSSIATGLSSNAFLRGTGHIGESFASAYVRETNPNADIEKASKAFFKAETMLNAFTGKYRGAFSKDGALESVFGKFVKGGRIPNELANLPVESQRIFLKIRRDFLDVIAEIANASASLGRRGSEGRILRNANMEEGMVQGYAASLGRDSVASTEGRARKREQVRRSELSNTRAFLNEMFGSYSGFARRLVALATPLSGILSAQKILGKYSGEADSIGRQAKIIGMASDRLYAFAKANEAAGGSGEGFRQAIEGWVMKTHRPAEDFIKVLSLLHGKTEREQQFFIKYHQLNRDQVQLFLQSRESAQELFKTIHDNGLTEADIENARKYREGVSRVKTAFDSVGYALARHLYPIAQKVLPYIEKAARFLKENSRFIIVFFGTLSVLLAGKFVASLLSASGAVGKLSKALWGLMANPLGATLAAILAVAAAVALVVEDLYVFAKGGESLFEKMLTWAGASNEEIEEFRNGIKALGEWISKVFNSEALKVGLRLFLDGLKAVLRLMGLVIRITKNLFTTVANLVKAILSPIMKLIDIYEKYVNKGKKDAKPLTKGQQAIAASIEGLTGEDADEQLALIHEQQRAKKAEEERLKLQQQGHRNFMNSPGLQHAAMLVNSAVAHTALQQGNGFEAQAALNKNSVVLTQNVNLNVDMQNEFNGETDPNTPSLVFKKFGDGVGGLMFPYVGVGHFGVGGG